MTERSKQVVLREMTSADFGRGVELCRIAGWNQLLADWQLFYACNPTGCFVAEHDHRVVGTVTTINYANRSSWIGMVLVDPEMRRMGIGTTLLNGALESLAGCTCIKLDATPAGKQLYDTLGFVDEYLLSRQTVDSMPALEMPRGVRAMSAEDLEAVIQRDAAAFGIDRPDVIRGLFAMAPELAFLHEDGGFVLGRPGKTFIQAGPLTCDNAASAQALAGAFFSQVEGEAVVIDIPLHTPAWSEWLTEIGFCEQRPFIRMVKGRNLPGKPELQFSISGPELG